MNRDMCFHYFIIWENKKPWTGKNNFILILKIKNTRFILGEKITAWEHEYESRFLLELSHFC